MDLRVSCCDSFPRVGERVAHWASLSSKHGPRVLLDIFVLLGLVGGAPSGEKPVKHLASVLQAASADCLTTKARLAQALLVSVRLAAADTRL